MAPSAMPCASVATTEPMVNAASPAEHQPEQHGDNERVGRGQDDRIGQRERCQEPTTTQHQPGLVAIPNGRDAVHRRIPLRADLESWKQDADAEIKPVHHHVGEDREGDDASPGGREVEVVTHACTSTFGPSASTPGAGVIPAARTGM